MNGNEGYWGGGISITSQNFPKSSSIHLIPPFPKQTPWVTGKLALAIVISFACCHVFTYIF
jgi:hypothetical protein